MFGFSLGTNENINIYITQLCVYNFNFSKRSIGVYVFSIISLLKVQKVACRKSPFSFIISVCGILVFHAVEKSLMSLADPMKVTTKQMSKCSV